MVNENAIPAANKPMTMYAVLGEPEESPEKYAANADGHGIRPNAAPSSALIE